MPYNVCDNVNTGTINDGGDITTALNDVISNIDNSEYTDPFIPNGIYTISSTIVWPHRAGYSLRGAGAIGETESYNASIRVQRTVIKWEGDPGDPMFEVRGKYAHFKGLCFNGRETGGGNASHGILVTRGGGSSIATGHSTWDRLSFWNLDYGIQNGNAVGENNCEELELYNLDFYDCGTAAFYNRGTQQLGVRFHNCRVHGVTPVFLLATGGGKIVMNQPAILTSGVTLLKTTQVPSGFGLNNATFTINQPIIDNVAGNSFKLVDGDSYNGNVTINGGVHSILDEEGEYTYTGEYVNVQGRWVVKFNGHVCNFNDMSGSTQAGYGTPLFIFSECGGFNRNPRLQLTGDYYVRQYACYNAVTNEPYDDYTDMADIEQSPVPPSRTAIITATSGSGLTSEDPLEISVGDTSVLYAFDFMKDAGSERIDTVTSVTVYDSEGSEATEVTVYSTLWRHGTQVKAKLTGVTAATGLYIEVIASYTNSNGTRKATIPLTCVA